VLLAGEKDTDEDNISTVKRRSRDHIVSTLKSDSHTATDIGLNCIVDNFLRCKSYYYIVSVWILD